MGYLLFCSFASIIPGLGYWLLGLRRRGTVIACIFVISLLTYWIATLISNIVVMTITQYIFIGVWIVQLLITFDSIYLRHLQIKSPEKVAILPEEGDNSDNLAQYHPTVQAAYKLIRAQSGIDDHQILAAILGFHMTKRKAFGYNPYRVLYLGLTNEFLMIIEADKLGTPMLVERVLNTKVKNAHYFQGQIIDRFELEIGEKEIINMMVTPSQRDQMRIFASRFSPDTK